ncbi:unnamed protein product [Mortierella alpina]
MPSDSGELKNGEGADIRVAIGTSVLLPSIHELEASMPDRQSPDPAGVEAFARWFLAHQLQMYHFYRSPAYKRKQWANSRGLRAEYEQILNVVLMTAGLQPHNLQGHMINIMVVVGDGQFDAARGGTSFHSKVIEFLYRKVSALTMNTTLTKEMRRVACPNCQVQIHRDSAGAHNIARIGMEELLYNARPASLRRPPRNAPPAATPGTAPMAPLEDTDFALTLVQAA